MVAIVFTVGTVNILLGYALAYYLRCALEQADTVVETPESPSQPEVAEAEPEPEPEPETAWEEDEELAGIEVEEVIPEDWVTRLEKESIEAKSLVEATAQVMRLEINKYREAVVRLEEEMRQHGEGISAGKLSGIIDRLIKVNRQWLAVQANASGHLNERLESLGQFDEIGKWLDKLLLDQQAQIESTCNNLTLVDVKADVSGAAQALVVEFSRLVNLAHQLRDGVGHVLFTVLRADDRLDALEESMREDSETEFRSSGGFEIDVNEWIKGDPGRQRLASALLMDLGEMEQFNRQYGTRFGDSLVAAAASLLRDVRRKDRGYEVFARLNGQQFVLFFGDTGPRNATSAAERMRQSFADALFEYGEHEIELTVSCAVTELLSTDDVVSLLDRLKTTLAAAKESGGNCTTLEEGNGPQPVTPPDYQLPSRVITVE